MVRRVWVCEGCGQRRRAIVAGIIGLVERRRGRARVERLLWQHCEELRSGCLGGGWQRGEGEGEGDTAQAVGGGEGRSAAAQVAGRRMSALVG